MDRLQFDLHGAWRISAANENGELCSSYPHELLIPSCISDKILEKAAQFRSYRRVPAVVWRYVFPRKDFLSDVNELLLFNFISFC